jgi:flagellar hook-associated protein 3 FlgL
LVSNSAKQQVRQSYSRLFDSQLQVSRGKKISAPSDDPNNIGRLLSFRERLGALGQYSQNAAEGRTFVDSSAATLQEASDIVQRARESVIQGLNGTLGQTDRDTIAIGIDGYIKDLMALANSQVGSRFIFAGTETDRPPYELTTDGSSQARVKYRGNDNRINAEVGAGLTSSINVPGSEIFGRYDRGATIFSGPTGAASGAGTDSGVGVDRLVVKQTGTTLGGASGLTLGTGSSTLDTVIGSHTIQIDDVAKTISLNGGNPRPYTGTETNLALIGPKGEKVHLDTTGVIGGFSGSATATGTGTLSIDGGATNTVIDFSANQQVTDSFSGEVINIDSTQVNQAGEDDVSFTGTHDLFQSLIALRDGLRDLDKRPDKHAALDLLRRNLEEFDEGHDQLLEGLGELGSISNRLSGAENRAADLDVRLQELISKTEDIDISDAIIQLQQNETAYQSALLVTSRVGNLSLLNFL